MKICIARSEKGRYSETFIQNQIDYLPEYADIYPVYDGRLPQRSEDGAFLAPAIIRAGNLLVRAITGRRNNFFGNYGLTHFLKRNQIDAVLANYGMAGVHILPICNQLQIPLVVHFHGFDATQEKVLEKYGSRYRQMFEQAAAIIAVSNEMKNKLVSLGAVEKKITLIPYGIDLEKFQPSSSSRKKNTFLAVGRFIGKKSPMSTIKAFAKVKAAVPDANLIMIGKKDNLFAQCESLSRELNIEDAIQFPGIKTPAEIARYMQEATVFVQHSVTAANGDKEGTPNTILEAAASELPIVSTYHAGIPEAVVNGKTGWLVKEHDVDGMAGYMLQLLRDPQQAQDMGRAGRQHIEQQYNLKTQIKKLFEVLKDSAAHLH